MLKSKMACFMPGPGLASSPAIKIILCFRLLIVIMKVKEHLCPGNVALTRSDPINIISTPKSGEMINAYSEVLYLYDNSLFIEGGILQSNPIHNPSY